MRGLLCVQTMFQKRHISETFHFLKRHVSETFHIFLKISFFEMSHFWKFHFLKCCISEIFHALNNMFLKHFIFWNVTFHAFGTAHTHEINCMKWEICAWCSISMNYDRSAPTMLQVFISHEIYFTKPILCVSSNNVAQLSSMWWCFVCLLFNICAPTWLQWRFHPI